MAMLTAMARSLVKTEDNIAIPCSVNASGWAPPRLPRVGVTFCDSKDSASSSSSWNMKSCGKRFGFRRTGW